MELVLQAYIDTMVLRVGKVAACIDDAAGRIETGVFRIQRIDVVELLVGVQFEPPASDVSCREQKVGG